MSVRSRPQATRRGERLGHLPRPAAADLLVPAAALGAAAILAVASGATLPAWARAGALAGYARAGAV